MIRRIVPSPISRQEVDRAVAGRTVPADLRDRVASTPDAPALRIPGSTGWHEVSWADYATAAARVAARLRDEWGIGPGDRVGVMMRNRPEFHLVDLGVTLAGAVPFSIYNSSSPEQVRYLVDHAGATAVVVDEALAPAVTSAGPGRAQRGTWMIPDTSQVLSPDRAWQEVMALDPVDLEAAAARWRPEDVATVIYTSGTTGPPKGVLLSQGNICWTLESLVRCLPGSLAGQPMLSYLPMAHVAERNFTHYLPIREGAVVTDWADLGTIHEGLTAVRPITFFGPPRVWERLWARLEEARRVGSVGERPGSEAEASRRFLGLDRCTTALTGAAPMPLATLRGFRGIGVPLSEIYGLSEDSGPATWDPQAHRDGTVGRAIPGSEIALADDGEVLCRGGHIFLGYLDDEAKTAEVLDAEGWLHTGDIGVIDDDGYLSIVDRKKDLIITAGGKNVSPANVEAALKQSPFIAQACVVGEGRPYITALLVLDRDHARAWCREQGVEVGDGPLADQPAVARAVQEAVDVANRDFARPEQVKRHLLLEEEWLPDSDVLTATMKLKRRGIGDRYADRIEELYRAERGRP